MSRLLLGLGLLSVSVMSQSMIVALLLLFVSVVLLRVLDGHMLTSLRLLRLLRWFVIPILLLHTLLTPGQLLMPELLIPVSREGVVQGVNLSLHLGAVFFVAMLMFRLLKQAEWLHYILLWPYLGQRLVVYVWMMNGMKMSITALLHDFRAQFRWRKDWQRSPLLLMSVFKQVLADASEHACMLWLRWPAFSAVEADQTSPALQYRVVSVLLAGMGCAIFVYMCL